MTPKQVVKLDIDLGVVIVLLKKKKKNPNKEKYLVESLTKTMAKRYIANIEKNWEGKDISFLSKLWAMIGYGGNNAV